MPTPSSKTASPAAFANTCTRNVHKPCLFASGRDQYQPTPAMRTPPSQ
jgi:hypothetical protein